MEAMKVMDGKVIGTLALLGFLGLVFRLYRALILKPKKLRQLMKEQGISGPSQKFLLGNITEIRKSWNSSVPKAAAGEKPVRHDCAGALFPFFSKWRKQFGEIFVFGLGNTQMVYVTKPDVIRDITTCTSLDLGKPTYQQKDLGPLFGHGILASNGTVWAHQRKIIAPELYMEKVKGMIGLVNESTLTLVNSWKNLVDGAGGVAEIKIDHHMRNFSSVVISRVCFGSNYAKGEEIFHKLRELEEAMSTKKLSTGIPGMRYIPTKHNRYAWAMEKEVRNLILDVVKERMQVAASEKDLLQMVLEGAKNSDDISQEDTDRFIVDNCKNIYLAGYGATAVSATWCFMLLAANPEWQDRCRAEALEVCGGRVPVWDMLRKMKQITMVIHETLRLYSPGHIISREAFKDMKFGDLKVPKGGTVWTFAQDLHTDPAVWGPDSYNFNPERFANGITGACKLPHLYMPFGVGPRVCLGQFLGMIELQIVLALILSNFSFTLSPKYVHSPALNLMIEPKFGVDLLVKKL